MKINHNLIASEKYSTNESIVGIWIDGKPIYRKVLTKTNNTGRDTSLATPTNIDVMVNMRVIAIHKNNKEIITIPANSISYSTGNVPRGVTYLAHNAAWNHDHLYVVQINGYRYIYAIIEYTKTTD